MPQQANNLSLLLTMLCDITYSTCSSAHTSVGGIRSSAVDKSEPTSLTSLPLRYNDTVYDTNYNLTPHIHPSGEDKVAGGADDDRPHSARRSPREPLKTNTLLKYRRGCCCSDLLTELSCVRIRPSTVSEYFVKTLHHVKHYSCLLNCLEHTYYLPLLPSSD